MSGTIGFSANMVIVGGNIAGSNCAIEACRVATNQGQSPDVVVLEARGDYGTPEKICGGIVPEFWLQSWRARGLPIDSVPHEVINELKVGSVGEIGNGATSASYTPATLKVPGFARVIRRRELDRFFMEQAQAAGARVMMGARCTDIQKNPAGKGVVLTFIRDGQEEQVTTNMLVGAFGANPPSAKRFAAIMGQPPFGQPGNNGQAWRDYLANNTPKGRIYGTGVADIRFFTHNGRAGYGWLAGESELDVGYGLLTLGPRERVKPEIGVPAIFPGLVDEVNGLRMNYAPLFPATPGSIAEAALVNGAIICLAGEAAGHTDPTTGEGIGPASEAWKLGAALANLSGATPAQKQCFVDAWNNRPIELNRLLSQLVAKHLLTDPHVFSLLAGLTQRYPELMPVYQLCVNHDSKALRGIPLSTVLAAGAMLMKDRSIVKSGIAIARDPLLREAARRKIKSALV